MKSFLKIDSGYEFKFRHFICINTTFKILKLLESFLIDIKMYINVPIRVHSGEL